MMTAIRERPSLVSIVIVNYNTFDLTCDCIASVKQFVSEGSYEIILVDNASTERSPQDFKVRFPEIVLIASAENLGFSKGNNLGIQKASGDFILLLNSDTVLANDAIGIVKQFLINHPDVAAASARLEYPDGRAQHNCQRFPSIKYSLFELFRLQKVFQRQSGSILFGFFFDYNSVAYPDWIWGTFFMFRKSLLGLFDDNKLPDIFFMYVEDMQWCMEFRKRGFRVAFVPEARIIHYLGKSGGNRPAMMQQNLDVFMHTYYGALSRKIIAILDKLLSR